MGESSNEREYKIEYQNDVTSAHSFSKNEAIGFIKEINSKLKPREYQLKSFIHCVRNKRALIVSPTASGKSYIIYMLSKWYGPVEKKLIIFSLKLIFSLLSFLIPREMVEDINFFLKPFCLEKFIEILLYKF